MFHKVIRKVNTRLTFLYRKNKFLTANLRRVLCNVLMQLHFDYVRSAWYPNISKKSKKNFFQTSQNKCIRFCLQMAKMARISQKEFEPMNWLPIKERFHQCINSIAFKNFDKECLCYLNEETASLNLSSPYVKLA